MVRISRVFRKQFVSKIAPIIASGILPPRFLNSPFPFPICISNPDPQPSPPFSHLTLPFLTLPPRTPLIIPKMMLPMLPRLHLPGIEPRRIMPEIASLGTPFASAVFTDRGAGRGEVVFPGAGAGLVLHQQVSVYPTTEGKSNELGTGSNVQISCK